MVLHTHCRHVKPAEERPHVSCSETNPNTQPEWAMKSSQGSSEGGPPCSVSTERPQPLPVLPSSLPARASPLFPEMPSDLTPQREASLPSQSPSTKPRASQSHAGRSGPVTTGPELSSGLLGAQLQGSKLRVTIREDLSSKHQHDHVCLWRASHGPPRQQFPFLIVIGRPRITDKGTGARGGRKAAVGPGSRGQLGLTADTGAQMLDLLFPRQSSSPRAPYGSKGHPDHASCSTTDGPEL